MAMELAAETDRKETLSDSWYLKGVAHLCESGVKRVPAKYVFPASDRSDGGLGGAGPKVELPIIDLSDLHTPNRPAVLRPLEQACQEYGFFQVLNFYANLARRVFLGIRASTARSLVEILPAGD